MKLIKTFLMWCAKALIIFSFYICLNGILNIFNLSIKNKNIIFYIGGFIVMLILMWIWNGEDEEDIEEIKTINEIIEEVKNEEKQN
jgi:small neutral amino acid transporter SnatA (MarC family)